MQGPDVEERRKHGGLTDEQVAAIKEAIMASVYEDIGRSIVKKTIWVVGAVLLALLVGFGAYQVENLRRFLNGG